MFTGCIYYAVEELSPSSAAAVPEDASYAKSREFIDAFFRNDGQAFVSMLTEEFQEKFTLDHYNNTRRELISSLGEPVSFSYITTLEMPVFTPHIWKVSFRKQNIATGEEITCEALLRVITAELDGEIIITAFQFI